MVDIDKIVANNYRCKVYDDNTKKHYDARLICRDARGHYPYIVLYKADEVEHILRFDHFCMNAEKDKHLLECALRYKGYIVVYVEHDGDEVHTKFCPNKLHKDFFVKKLIDECNLLVDVQKFKFNDINHLVSRSSPPTTNNKQMPSSGVLW